MSSCTHILIEKIWATSVLNFSNLKWSRRTFSLLYIALSIFIRGVSCLDLIVQIPNWSRLFKNSDWRGLWQYCVNKCFTKLNLLSISSNTLISNSPDSLRVSLIIEEYLEDIIVLIVFFFYSLWSSVITKYSQRIRSVISLTKTKSIESTSETL